VVVVVVVVVVVDRWRCRTELLSCECEKHRAFLSLPVSSKHVPLLC
jgi:hypothetical protein